MMLDLSHTSRLFAKASAAAFLVLLIVLPAASAWADEPPVIEINAAEAADTGERSSIAPKIIFSPEEAESSDQNRGSTMMEEIRIVVELGRAQARELESRAAMATDEESILAIQGDIEALAQETELEILSIQVNHARSAGREALAARIEQDIADIQNPPVVRVRLERPELDSQ